MCSSDLNHSLSSAVMGVSGNTSAQMLARYATDVAGNGAEALVVAAGTNDAGSSVTLDSYIANMSAIFGAARRAGIPVVACTVPPRASGATTTIKQLTNSYNIWLRMVAPTFGVKVADVHKALVDSASGNLLSTYDSGDGVHPSGRGHIAMARVVSAAMVSVTGVRPSVVDGINPVNSVQNPICAGASTIPTSWYEQPTGTGTAPTYSIENDTSGLLQSGRWAQIDFDAVSGGTRKYAQGNTAAVTAGDVVAVAYRLAVDDVSGNADANFVAGTGLTAMNILNQSAVNVANETPCPGPFLGPSLRVFTVPAGMTGVLTWVSVTLPSGQRMRVRIGEVGIFNLTTLGLTSAIV